MKDYVGLNILNAITLYGVTISSFNQPEPLVDPPEEILSDSEDDENSKKLQNLQEELSNIISLTKLEIIDFHKATAGSGI